MADESTPTTDTIAEGGGEQSRPNLQEINERPRQTDPLEARRAAAQESERYSTDDLSFEDGQVRVRDRALKREAAAGTPYEPSDLSVEDGEVRARDAVRDDRREQSRTQTETTGPTDSTGYNTATVISSENGGMNISDVGVGPLGDKRPTPGGNAVVGGDEIEVSTSSEGRVFVNGERVTTTDETGGSNTNRYRIGELGAGTHTIRVGETTTTVYVPPAENVPSEASEIPDAEQAYDQTVAPQPQDGAATDNPDVVAGAGADEALQAGAEPEQLSSRNPIDESEGEQIADRIDGPQSESSTTTISDPTDLNDRDDNRAVRERVAGELDGVSADEVDIVATGAGYEAVGPGGETVTSLGSGGGVPGRQPTDATFDGSRSVGDRSTGAGATAGLEAARREARRQVAGQSDRIDESDVQTEVVDGRVRGYVPATEQQSGGTNRALEGGDARLLSAADDGVPPVEGGDVALANAAEQQRSTNQTERIRDPTEVSGGDVRLQTVADAQQTELRAADATAEEPLNYGRRAKYAAGVDVLLGSADDAVARAFEADAEAGPYRGAPIEAGDAMFGSIDEAIGRAGRASAQGDRARAADNLAGGLDDAARGASSAIGNWASVDVDAPGDGSDNILPGVFGDAAAAGAAIGEDLPERSDVETPLVAGIYSDAAARGAAIGGKINDEIEGAEVNQTTTDRLTRDGFLSEKDEKRLSEAAGQFNQDVRSGVDEAAAVSPLTVADETVRGGLEAAGADTDLEASTETQFDEVSVDTERLGEGNIERTQEAAGETVVTAINPFALAQAGETGVEVASNLDEEVTTGRAGSAAVGASALAIGRETGDSIVTEARTDPTSFAGGLAGEAVLGAGIGRGIGTAARRGTDRIRTTGGTRVELEGVTNPETAAFYRGETRAEEARFPGADDPELYRSNPPEAVRQQASRYTPAPIQDQFERAGVTEGTDLKKAIETEPEGPNAPDIGRGAGFQTQEGGYESPGAFAGPELSPNFLEVGDRSYSIRPGLPGLGGRPTGVIARTDVEAPDADTLDEFSRELVDERAGETTAYTKPADAVNTGEIETVIPPEAGFRAVDDVGSGGNRFGVGAGFYTEVAGRRVPLRLVAPEDRVDADVDATSAVDDLDDAGGRPIESYYRASGDEVDRPSPTPSQPSSPLSSRGASGAVSDPLSGARSESSAGSRRDSRVVSDSISSGLGSAGTSPSVSGVGSSGGFGSSTGGTPTEVGTPTDFSEYQGGGFYEYDEPTETATPSEIYTPSTPGVPDDTPDPRPQKTPDPEINLPEPENRFYESDAETDPEKFKNRVATPFGFLF